MNRSWFLIACFAFSMFIAACGDSGVAEGGGEDGQIEAAIRTVAFSNKPAKCTEAMTQGFLEQSTKSTGFEALKSCVREAGDASNNPKSVAISRVAVHGSKATANAAFVGGGFNGQTVTVTLVKEKGQWKVDELTGFAELDKAALAETYGEQLKEAGGLKAPQVKCIVGGLEEAPRPKIEQLVLGKSSAPLIKLAKRCA